MKKDKKVKLQTYKILKGNYRGKTEFFEKKSK